MDAQARQATRLWTAAQPVVSAFVTSVVRDFAARQDVLQETAVAVIESFDRYDPSRTFVAWALGVARNQVRLYLRRTRRDRHVFDDETVAALAVAFEASAADEAEAERLDRLKECVDRLPAQARELCDLRYVDDLKPAAIAAARRMAPNTVSKALQRIREQLRACVERRGPIAGSVAAGGAT